MLNTEVLFHDYKKVDFIYFFSSFRHKKGKTVWDKIIFNLEKGQYERLDSRYLQKMIAEPKFSVALIRVIFGKNDLKCLRDRVVS